MYLITLYFDESTNQKLETYIKQLAKCGNESMKEIVPHLTIASFHDHLEEVIEITDKIDFLHKEIILTSFGFFPDVVYTQAVLSKKLYEAYLKLHASYSFDGYLPHSSLLHVTLIKHLTHQEFEKVMQILNHQKFICKGKISKITITRQATKEIVYAKE